MAADSNNISPSPDVAIGSPLQAEGAPTRRYRYSSNGPASPTSAANSPPTAHPSPALGSISSGVITLQNPLASPGALAAIPEAVQTGWNRVWLVLAAAGLCLWALYPSELQGLVEKWYSDAGWSHGFVVPLISIYLIREKWDVLRVMVPRRAWAGLGVLLLGVVGQVLFRATGTTHMSNLSMLIVLLGLALFILGWDFMKVLWLPITYLIFAIPPPATIYAAITAPMQLVAAEVGCWFLPLFGCDAHRTGTIIEIFTGSGIQRLDVEQACSGMRMLVAFFALAVALAYSTSRPTWQKVFLAGCALPIAIFCNALRVTLTGVLVVRVGQQWGQGNAHVYFGLLMLIPALFMQLGMAWVLDHLFVETDEVEGGVR